jgi:hypothetical protein
MTALRRLPVFVLALACLLPAPAAAHPGTGIVVDRLGQIYFVDMVSGIWKLDRRGVLTQIRGPAFHWMALDAADRFSSVDLPSGPGWEIDRISTNPTLLLSSDFPIAMGRDGNLYYPTHGRGTPLQILKVMPSGQTSILATLPTPTAGGPLRDITGIAAARDGSLYYAENDAIRRISREGRVSTLVQKVGENCDSTSGKPASHNPLFRGLDVDSTGTIYVAATGCGAVLRITRDGHVTIPLHLAGTWAPTGVFVSGSDVYVLEFEHPDSDDRREMLPRVRKIGRDGKSTVIAAVTRH